MSPTASTAAATKLRKERGAFFTPPELCRYIAEWAIRDSNDHVLEPSCGEAAFLLEAGTRLTRLQKKAGVGDGTLHGIEVHEESAKQAFTLLQATGLNADIEVADFFSVEPTPQYDAVIGNPPYIRYQDFGGESRARSQAAALRAGVALTGLASSWAAFTVHATLFLKPEGCLGLVLPAELLTVNYASEVRRYLMERFARIRLVLFTERVFPDVEEEIVLLLAEGIGPTDHCEVYRVQGLGDLLADRGVSSQWKPIHPEEKWISSLLSPAAQTTYTEMLSDEAFTPLETWGDITLGMVTGNNRYFTMSPARATELELSLSNILPLSPPGSSHLRGLTLDHRTWRELGAAGQSTFLFRPQDEPSPAAISYIESGRVAGVDKAYKCRVRSPWWRVPLVKPADILLTYMNADTPRLCANDARVHHLNSVHGLYLKPGMFKTGVDLLPLGSLNSMTLLGAELVGRAYGGGILKLEPREADQLPVPTRAALEQARTALMAIRPQVAEALRSGQLLEAARLVDDILLIKHLGLDTEKVQTLRDARAQLFNRRVARAASARIAA